MQGEKKKNKKNDFVYIFCNVKEIYIYVTVRYKLLKHKRRVFGYIFYNVNTLLNCECMWISIVHCFDIFFLYNKLTLKSD